MIICNTRCLDGQLTGVQRYTAELVKRAPADLVCMKPARPARGVRGHFWDQVVLPLNLKGRLLWSPTSAAPLMVRHQVVSIMDVSPLDHPEWFSARYASWYRFLMPRVVKVAQAIITISEFSKARLCAHFPWAQSKIHVTPLAADERFRPYEAAQCEPVLQRAGLPTRRYLLGVGSLVARKNIRRLLAAWEQITPRLPSDVWLVLVGAQADALVFGQSGYGRLPARVHLTGHMADEALPVLYAGALGSVYLSLYEGFGLPPLESMASGTPVIASNTTSIPEVVGEAALSVDPCDENAIGAAMLRLATEPDLVQTLRAQGLAQAARFSWQRTADQTFEILHRYV